ncbi:MAG: methyltransferase domain-containing protein [Gemmatimonadales bacterium]
MSEADRGPGPALGAEYDLRAPVPSLTAEQLAVRAAILDTDDARDWEVTLCPCGGPGPDTLLSEVDRHGLPARNVVCERCGLVRLSPRWREERYLRFYETEYRSLYNPSALDKPAYARWVADAPATRERAAWVVAAVAMHSKAAKPRIVEIGAGGGWNLAGLPRKWERIGYDVDDAYLAVGREAFGLDMRHGLADVALPALAAADLVLLSHVVEHLPDPSATLRTIAAAMPPDALLLIEVPGIFRIHRTNLDPRSYLQNAHTFTFCAPTLRDACGRAGLVVLEIEETARAACRPRGVIQRGDAHPGLAERIIAYLRRCDYGYRQYRRLGAVPLVGRYLAYGWKCAWFGLL